MWFLLAFSCGPPHAAFPWAEGNRPRTEAQRTCKRKAEAPAGKRPWQLAGSAGRFTTTERKATGGLTRQGQGERQEGGPANGSGEGEGPPGPPRHGLIGAAKQASRRHDASQGEGGRG